MTYSVAIDSEAKSEIMRNVTYRAKIQTTCKQTKSWRYEVKTSTTLTNNRINATLQSRMSQRGETE